MTIGLGGFVWLTANRRAQASNPASPQSAQYSNHPGPGGIECASCAFFIPDRPNPHLPGRCQLITGPVGPVGHCDFYARR